MRVYGHCVVYFIHLFHAQAASDAHSTLLSSKCFQNTIYKWVWKNLESQKKCFLERWREKLHAYASKMIITVGSYCM